MKYLGIDFGTKRIGVAVSDDTGVLAFPLEIVGAGPEALSRVTALAKEKGAEKIIIGESRDFKGAPNPVMEDIEQFKTDLQGLSGLPVEYYPEFLTSLQAARVGQDKRGGGGMEKSDAAAAALILQGFLDRMKNHGSH